MKRQFFLGILFVLINSIASAQSVESQIKQYIADNGFEISTEQYVYLSEGEQGYFYKQFYAGNDYAIIAYSEDFGILDIDIYLYDDDGSLLVKDTDSDKLAIVTYSPYVTRKMKVVVKNYQSESQIKEYKCKIIVAFTN